MRPSQVFPRRFVRRAVVAGLLALLLPASALAYVGNGKLQIHHIDVGQGDGALLISPNGQTALFDDGNYLNCTNIKNYLQGLGITSVDYHFLSHYHSDHFGCLDDLAAIGITIVANAYDRGYSYSSGTYTTYVNTIGALRTTIAKNQVITLDAGSANPVTIKCIDLNGAGVYSPTGSDENSKSVDLLVSYGAFQEEIGGDLTGDPASGNDVETTVGPEVGDVEVYKAHHHGSRYSNNDNWLNAVTPEVCIISCGDGNSYGHPTTDALTRMHNHGVHTYWTELGSGAAPDPSWDKVGHGTIVIQAQPGVGDPYTITGPGINDTWYNGGGSPPPPPIHTTEFASSLTMLKGTLTTGDVTRLQVSDDSRIGVSAGLTSGKYFTDWYASALLSHVPLNLTITCEASYTVSCTMTLSVYNWSTSAWNQVSSSTVGTTDVTKTWSTPSPASYVGPGGEVRFRVAGSQRKSTYTSRCDYVAFDYDYAAGSSTVQLAAWTPRVVGAGAAPVAARGPESTLLGSPQAVLERLDASCGAAGAQLSWAVGTTEDVDGFNVYREAPDGSRVFVGNDAALTVEGTDAVFRFVDPAGAGGAVYWLGARGCSGPEGLIGPIEVAPSTLTAAVEFAVAPNPTAATARLGFTLARAADVKLEVFDVRGRRVATPLAGRRLAGPVEAFWDLRDVQGQRVEPGVYFSRLEVEGRASLRRVVVLAN